MKVLDPYKLTEEDIKLFHEAWLAFWRRRSKKPPHVSKNRLHVFDI